jgi:hypothetical protein
MATTKNHFRIFAALTLSCGLTLLSPLAAGAQSDFDQQGATDNQEEYERYRDSRRDDQLPPPPPRPPRMTEPLVPDHRIAPRYRYDDPTFDDYWHDRLQQYRFQDWYGDNYRRYWPPNYKGYFRKQNPPYYWWNPGDGRRDTGYRAYQSVQDRRYR